MAEFQERRDPRQFDEMMQRMADTAARRAVSEGVPPAVMKTLQGLGIDTSDPISVQRDMAYLRDSAIRSADPEVRLDREWTRRSRQRCERVHEAAVGTGVKMAVGAAGTALLLGVGVWLKSLM